MRPTAASGAVTKGTAQADNRVLWLLVWAYRMRIMRVSATGLLPHAAHRDLADCDPVGPASGLQTHPASED